MSPQVAPSCMSFQETSTDSMGEPCDSAKERTSVEQMDVGASSCSEKSVCTFYLEGKCRFGENCFNLHPEGVALGEKRGGSLKEEKKKNGQRKKTHIKAENKEHGKRPSMKTAGDVRKRIQWDSDLRKEYFVVGYLDRFVGVIEKPFTAFTWEHLATVGIDQLAIPQHRIQYFKYRGVKVWDKNERLDNVFGSTGSNVTIQDVMQEVDEEFEKRQTYESDDSDSDDEDIVICTGDTSAIKEAVQTQKQEYDQLRASHFLCIRVYNDELKNIALEVQESIIEQEPVLRNCAMPTELFHVTLAMIRIDDPEAMLKLIELLQELRAKLQEMVADQQQSQILAKGLSTFVGARVLYCKLQVPEAFSRIVETLHQSLEKVEGVVITDQHDFVPHMTLMKVNRVIARERGSEYLNSILYSDYVDKEFGFIPINNINLCNTDDERGYDGFYFTCQKIEL
ncbi:uncharacterized protein LOC135212888 [Macrobrachium nipponense]|uniref:uncharacterized protein LOC135212888 n=1 Tax=Macrobrachium nipponense TaxID=159736 RepID=UPI0030C89D36